MLKYEGNSQNHSWAQDFRRSTGLPERARAGRFENDVCESNPLTPATQSLGNAPQFWINLQAQYDLAVALRAVGRLVAREVQTAA